MISVKAPSNCSVHIKVYYFPIITTMYDSVTTVIQQMPVRILTSRRPQTH